MLRPPNRGGVLTGIINNYYWDRLHAGFGDKSTRSAIYHFGKGDVGGAVNVSGAAVLKVSKRQPEAQKFVAYLVSERAETDGRRPYQLQYPLHRASRPIRS